MHENRIAEKKSMHVSLYMNIHWKLTRLTFMTFPVDIFITCTWLFELPVWEKLRVDMHNC